MNRLVYIGLGVAALLIAFAFGLRVGKHHADAVMAQAQSQAKAHQEAEDAAHAQAGKLQQDANDADARAVDAGREVASTKSKLAKLRGQDDAVPSIPDVPVDAVHLGGVPGTGGNEPLVVIQDQVISAQDKQIGALTDENKALRGANAALETALKQADIKADIQAQASKAALEGLKKAKWLDRLEVGGACLATGYGLGRIRR